MAGIFTVDPEARFGGNTGWGYRGAFDFHQKTGGLFRRTGAQRTEAAQQPLAYPAGAGVNLSQRPDEPDLAYREPPPGGYGDPDYVSPALRRAREQLESSEELFTDRWDDTVFGKPYD